MQICLFRSFISKFRSQSCKIFPMACNNSCLPKKEYSQDVRNDAAFRARPNYFVAVQVSDVTIHDKIRTIQEHMIQQDNCVEDIMIDPSTLHITLMVMHIKDREELSSALEALRKVHEEFNKTMCNDPITLDFSGLGHFGNRVLFAKVKENKSLNQLRTLVESVKNHFAEEGILSTDTRPFNPHLTIAKSKYNWQRKIATSLYEDFVDEEMGSQTIRGIQLLSMDDPKDERGYYKGHELLFRL